MSAIVPPLNHPCWLRLANGGLSRITTKHLGTQLMTKRLERSAAPAPDRAAEIHSFFARWERALPNEIAQLSRA